MAKIFEYEHTTSSYEWEKGLEQYILVYLLFKWICLCGSVCVRPFNFAYFQERESSKRPVLLLFGNGTAVW